MENSMADICKFAKRYDRVQSLMRFVNEDTLRWSYQELMRGGKERSRIATEYGKQLDENLDNLLRRMKNFSYWPQSRDGASGTRKLKHEFKVLEDMLVAGVFKDILAAIYEVKGCVDMSSGFQILKPGVNSRRIRFLQPIFCEVNVVRPMSKVDKNRMIAFLNENIDDRKFMNYTERFLRCENLGHGNLLESDSRGMLSSMFERIFIFHILRDGLISRRTEIGLKMMLWVRMGVFIFATPNLRDLSQLRQMLLGMQEECGLEINIVMPTTYQHMHKLTHPIRKPKDYVLDEGIVVELMY